MPVSEDEVEKVITDLEGKFPAGIDELPDLIVEKCLKFIKKPLTDICNAGMDLGIFPDRINFVIIKHLHKKGDAEYIQNYRPISLVSDFSRILERYCTVD
jgi:hypothetical protein